MDHLLIAKYGALAIVIDSDDEGAVENNARQDRDDENVRYKSGASKG